MNQLLNTVDNQLRQARPDYYLNLNAPLNDVEIVRLEQQYSLTIPDDLRQLYNWKNGQSTQDFAAFVNNSMFLSLDEALSIAQENTAMIDSDFDIENWWNSQWIPIFHNGGGDYICYDRGGLFTGHPGQLIEFWHADNDRNVIAPDLQSFLTRLIDYYDQISPRLFDSYFRVDSPEGYPKLFVV